MALDSRFHTLFFGYLLLLGLTDLMVARLGEPTSARVLLGFLYIAVAAYQLSNSNRSAPALYAAQLVD
jgi:hypothetical protein